MSNIVEAVAKAIETALVSGSASVGDERLREIASAAIEAYELATAKQEMHDQRVIWEAVERMKINPTKEKVWPTIDYFNGVPLTELNEEQRAEYAAYMRSSRP